MAKKDRFMVQLYTPGNRRAVDAHPDFFNTREAAHRAGKASMRDSGKPDALNWAHRYTVKRIPPMPE